MSDHQTTVLTNGAYSIINPTQEQIAQHAYLRILAAKTEQFIRDSGRDAVCVQEGCRMTGLKCPRGWCEGVYLRIRRELQNGQ